MLSTPVRDDWLNARSNAIAPRDADDETGAQLRQHASQHEPADLTRLRPECDPQPELPRPPFDRMAGHGIETDERQNQCDDRDARE